MDISKKELKVGGAVFAIFFSVVAMALYVHIDHAKHILEGGNGTQEAVAESTQVSQKNSFVQEDVKQDDVPAENQKMDSQEKPQMEFDFAVIGDSENEKQDFGFDTDVIEVLDRVKILQPDMIFFTGDIIMASADPAGVRTSVQFVKKTLDKYFGKIPYYIAFGNHDLECGVECVEVWQDVLFGKKYKKEEDRIPYYSFDHQNTHFVILSTHYPKERSLDEKQLQWLMSDLDKNKKENTIVLMHVPPITFFEEDAQDCHDFGCQPDLQKRLVDIFKKNHVDLVISGHDNAFNHKIIDGIDFILSGNATYSKPQYDGLVRRKEFTHVVIKDTSIVLQDVDVSGKILSEIKIK